MAVITFFAMLSSVLTGGTGGTGETGGKNGQSGGGHSRPNGPILD